MTEPLVVETPEDREIRLLQEGLEAANRKKNLARELAMQKALTDQANAKAEAERQRFEQQQAHERKVAEITAKRKAAADAAAAEEAAKAAAQRHLEQEVAKREVEAQAAAAHKKRVAALENEKFQAEAEAARILQEMAHPTTHGFEPAPVSVTDSSHPLSFLFRGTSQKAVNEGEQGLSSEQQSRIQNEIDRKAEALAAIARGEQPAAPVYAAEPAPVIPQERTSRRKTKAYADGATSLELESLLRRNLHISPNPGRCDQLSAVWEASDLLETAKRIIVNCQGKPMSHDYVFAMLEIALQAPMVEEAGAQHVTQA